MFAKITVICTNMDSRPRPHPPRTRADYTAGTYTRSGMTRARPPSASGWSEGLGRKMPNPNPVKGLLPLAGSRVEVLELSKFLRAPGLELSKRLPEELLMDDVVICWPT